MALGFEDCVRVVDLCQQCVGTEDKCEGVEGCEASVRLCMHDLHHAMCPCRVWPSRRGFNVRCRFYSWSTI
eukprot:364903-Chlamydomonas_euryale.AAC.4